MEQSVCFSRLHLTFCSQCVNENARLSVDMAASHEGVFPHTSVFSQSRIYYSAVSYVETDRGTFIRKVAAPHPEAVCSCASVHVHSFGPKHVSVVRTKVPECCVTAELKV